MPYKNPEDQRKAVRAHYEANKQAYRARAIASSARTRAAIIEFVAGYLSAHPCIDCGETDLVVLEFDHRDPAEKLFSIGSVMTGNRRSLKSVQSEVAKCDVRCANCHRRKTAISGGFYRTLLTMQQEKG